MTKLIYMAVGRKALPKELKKSKIVTIRLTENEFENLTKSAEKLKIKPSELARKKVLENI